jgi:hypothetical protein
MSMCVVCKVMIQQGESGWVCQPCIRKQLVPATTQPSAPVVVCKAFCGMTHAQLALDAQASKDWIADPGYSLPDNRIRWCSPACRDARLPPLAAQPAEAKRRFSEAALKMGCDCPPGLECATCKPFYDAEQSPYLLPCGQRASTPASNVAALSGRGRLS